MPGLSRHVVRQNLHTDVLHCTPPAHHMLLRRSFDACNQEDRGDTVPLRKTRLGSVFTTILLHRYGSLESPRHVEQRYYRYTTLLHSVHDAF